MPPRERLVAGLALSLSLSGYACSKDHGADRKPATVAAGAAGRGASENGGASGASHGRAEGGEATGGAGGGGALSQAPLAELLSDAGAWEKVTTLSTCATRVARAPEKTWPSLRFAACGTGCRRASVVPSSVKSLGALLGTAARVVDGQLRLTVSARVTGKPTTFVLATYDFPSSESDGKPLAVLTETGACFAQVAGRASPNLYKLFPLNGDEVFRFAWLGETAAPKLTWLPQSPSLSLELFDTGARWGGIDSFAEVEVAAAADSLELSPLYQSTGALRAPAGSAGAAVWSEWNADAAQGKLFGWEPKTGLVEIAKGGWVPARVAASSTRVAWLGATGARAFEGAYESAKLYTCARSSRLAACEPSSPITLPLASSTGVLSVSDRWAALTGCSTASCDVIVIDLSDGSAHRLKPQSGHGIEVLGVSETELFAADFGPETRGTPDFDAILRFDLSRLEDFTTAL